MVHNWIPVEDKVIYDLIRFENVQIRYNLSEDINVEFTMDKSVKGSTKDWIGIFQAGWHSFESFLAFEWGIGVPIPETKRKRKITICTKYIQNPKPNTHYQFVYVSKYLEILGVSQFFQFLLTEGEMAGDVTELNLSLPLPPFVQTSSPLKDHDVRVELDPPHHSNAVVPLLKDNTQRSLVAATPLSNCKLYSPTRWKQLCTSCHQCNSLFQMNNSQQIFIEKVREYEELNSCLRERLSRMEQFLVWEQDGEDEQFRVYMDEVAGAIDRAIHKTVFGRLHNKPMEPRQNVKIGNEQNLSLWELDMTKKELYLKALLGHQEITIQKLNQLVYQVDQQLKTDEKTCEKSMDRSSDVEDVVRLVKTEQKVIAEVYDLKSSN